MKCQLPSMRLCKPENVHLQKIWSWQWTDRCLEFFMNIICVVHSEIMAQYKRMDFLSRQSVSCRFCVLIMFDLRLHYSCMEFFLTSAMDVSLVLFCFVLFTPPHCSFLPSLFVFEQQKNKPSLFFLYNVYDSPSVCLSPIDMKVWGGGF